jgi:cell division protein FtsZ
MLPGLINLDFADVRTTMLNAGDAILGIGMGVGEHRATLAAEKAVASPLLETSVEGARSMLLSITGGPDLSLIEASEAAEVVRQAAHPEAEIIFGAGVDEDMSEEVWITVIATRFDNAFARRHRRDRRSEPREPRSLDRDAVQRRERSSDPLADWRALPNIRHGSADDLYGEDNGRGRLDRRPAEPRSIENRVLDVPEFDPDD